MVFLANRRSAGFRQLNVRRRQFIFEEYIYDSRTRDWIFPALPVDFGFGLAKHAIRNLSGRRDEFAAAQPGGDSGG
jgi:hypothetical protein